MLRIGIAALALLFCAAQASAQTVIQYDITIKTVTMTIVNPANAGSVSYITDGKVLPHPYKHFRQVKAFTLEGPVCSSMDKALSLAVRRAQGMPEQDALHDIAIKNGGKILCGNIRYETTLTVTHVAFRGANDSVDAIVYRVVDSQERVHFTAWPGKASDLN